MLRSFSSSVILLLPLRGGEKGACLMIQGLLDLQRIVIVLHGCGTPVIFTILPKRLLMPGALLSHLNPITVGGRDLLNKVC